MNIWNEHWSRELFDEYIMLLLQLLSGSEEADGLLERFDWYIMPIFNVDGYEYTWNNVRYGQLYWTLTVTNSNDNIRILWMYTKEIT